MGHDHPQCARGLGQQCPGASDHEVELPVEVVCAKGAEADGRNGLRALQDGLRKPLVAFDAERRLEVGRGELPRKHQARVLGAAVREDAEHQGYAKSPRGLHGSTPLPPVISCRLCEPAVRKPVRHAPGEPGHSPAASQADCRYGGF